MDGIALALALIVMGCGDPTTPHAVSSAALAVRAESAPDVARSTSTVAHDLVLQQLAFTSAVTRTASIPPTCTILRLYSPSLNFDRTTKVGNCGACVPGHSVLAVATSGAGGAGNTAIAPARCGGVDVAGPASAQIPAVAV